jgi:hypothetical protein
MKVIYRISDGGYKKQKPNYITKIDCFENALKHFYDFYIIQDGELKDENVLFNMIRLAEKYNIKSQRVLVNVGNGAGTFNLALDYALTLDDNEIVYFLEDDYLHRDGAQLALEDAFKLPIDYATLYDHPDKYMNPSDGGNPFCEGLSEQTRVYCGLFCHYKITNSTTMTFAAKVSTLKRDEAILRKWTNGTHPNDFEMFKELCINGKLVSSIPAYSTHGETQWLSPLINWENI